MLVAEIVFSQIDLVQKFIFPRFIELLLYFYHFYVVCYDFVFNERLSKHCLEKALSFRQTFPFALRNYLIFVL